MMFKLSSISVGLLLPGVSPISTGYQYVPSTWTPLVLLASCATLHVMAQEDSDYEAEPEVSTIIAKPKPVTLFEDIPKKAKAGKSKGSKGGGESCVGGCSVDCLDFFLKTTDAAGNGASGNMFTVTALQDLEITSFAAHLDYDAFNATELDSVRVYTREGTYEGFEQNSSGWELIHDVLVNDLAVEGYGDFTELEDFVEPVFICAGTNRSFFVYSDVDVDYTNGADEGTVFVADAAMEILEGVGLSDEFTNNTSIFSPRVWNGEVR